MNPYSRGLIKLQYGSIVTISFSFVTEVQKPILFRFIFLLLLTNSKPGSEINRDDE